MTTQAKNLTSFSEGIADNGFVGIGTTSPTHRFHINQPGNSPQLRISGNANWDFYSYNDNNLYINCASGTVLGLLANRSAYFDTNLGISTPSPSAKLHIVDGNNIALIGDLNSNSTMSLRMSDNSAQPVEVQAYSRSLKLRTTPSGGSITDRVTIDADGNVGIGTDSPSTKLHIKGGSNEDAELRLFPSDGVMDAVISFTGQDDNTTNEGAQIWYDNNVGDLHIVSSYDNSNGGIRFHTRQPGHKQEGNERLTIAGDGNVGIGTANPQGIFHIESAGDIILGDPTGFGNANKTRIHSQYGGIQYDALQIRNETATVQGRGAGISFWGGSNASRIAGVVASTSDTNDLTKGKLSLYATDYVNIDSTSAIRIARGTNSERPASPSTGMIRFNTTSASYEGWTGTEWTILSNTSSIVSTGLLANFQPNNISDGSTSWNDSTGNYAFAVLNLASGSIVKDGPDAWYGSGTGPGFKSSGGVSALNFGTGNFTLECWVYFSTTAYGTWKYIMGKSNFWDTNSYGFYIDSGGSKVGFHWTNSNGTEVNLSGIGVGWHHLAAVGSGGNSIKFYIDGNLEASATPSYNLSTTEQISFNGDEAAYHLTSNERFGSARWYNIALTSEQVNQNRNAEIARY